MKNAALFVGLALGGAGLYLWLKGQPKASGVVGTTGTARTDPGFMTQFAGLFGRGQASTISNQGGGGGYDSAISTSISALGTLAKRAMDAIIGAGGSNNPTGKPPLQKQKLPDGAGIGSNPVWDDYPATPMDAYTDAGFNPWDLTVPTGDPPPLTGRNFGLEEAFDSASSDGWNYEWEFDS